MDSRLVTQRLNEIALAPPGSLHLGMTADARLREAIRIRNEWVDTSSG
ncbi:hypothetical protein PCO31110_04127 [Pandoraea communis]|uniref:Uncharacterized protein n=1 Tax=Pandoraea communis TaxID=2508297 RepID=A0A5E4XTV8_9BURK|nr:hypothetical protein [Pandoraea communis]VVE39515.1 hypothetical protein PCO31110_04127 [Pandoraea communis]